MVGEIGVIVVVVVSGEKNVVNFCKEAPASSTALLLFLFSVPLLYFILSIELSSMLELS